MKYVVYDQASGEIIVSGACDVPDARGLGTLLEDVEGATSTHYVSAGSLVPYTSDQAATKSARPDYDTAWSNTTMSWGDLRSLDQAKADKREQLKASRSAVVYSTFDWSGSTFDCDADSQALIQGAVLDAIVAGQLGATYSVTWTLADNSVRTLSATEVIQVGLAMSAHIQTNFNKGQSLQSAIASATSADQLEAIQWA